MREPLIPRKVFKSFIQVEHRTGIHYGSIISTEDTDLFLLILYYLRTTTTPSIIQTIYPPMGRGVAAANPSCHWTRGVHQGQVASQSQGHIQYIGRAESPTNLTACLWVRGSQNYPEKTHRAKMQTAHRDVPEQAQESTQVLLIVIKLLSGIVEIT